MQNKNLKEDKMDYKTYLINLEKDRNRLEFMSKQLSDLKIDFERVPAILGKDFNWSSDVYDSHKSIEENGRDLTPGERGCAMSHRTCYQKLLGSDSEYALILEDDVELNSKFKSILEIEINKNKRRDKNKFINKKWEYLSFDYPEPGIFFIKHWANSILLNYSNNSKGLGFKAKIKYIAYSFVKACYVLPLAIFEWTRNTFYKRVSSDGDAVNFYRPLYLSGAYVLSKSAAQKLLELSTPIVYASDRVPNQARSKKGMSFMAYSPLCVHQRRQDFGSSILDVSGEHFKE